LIADSDFVVRLDTNGHVVKTYALPGESEVFALNLDPDGKSLWTADYGTGDVIEVNISTGAVECRSNAGTTQVYGLSVHS
jgi:hypothetical protein